MVKQKAVSGHYAAIDIGSNAVRLLIKDIRINQDGFVSTKEQLIRVPLRLGFDVFTKDKISKSKAKDLLKLIKAYSDIMDLYEVNDYKAYATSAIRDAENGKKIVSWIKEKTGVRIHILTGQEEARLLYRTHSEFIQDKEGDFMYVDVGGGSTELNLMLKGQLAYSRSYNIGTIRVLSNTVDPAEWDRLERDLTVLMKSHSNIEILGTGGNINKIFRLVEEKDKKLQRMTVASLEEINHHMSRMSLVERVKSYKLKYDRAEVIVPASHIFLTIARLIGASYIYVPTVGLVDGIIDEVLLKRMSKKKVGVVQKEEQKEEPKSCGETVSESCKETEAASLCSDALSEELEESSDLGVTETGNISPLPASPLEIEKV